MNITEQVIVEQFPFWGPALAQPLPTLNASTVVVVGCGTSYYLAQVVASALNLNGQCAIAVPGGEWARRPDAYLAATEDAQVIALSRSGESTETVQAVQASRVRGLKTLGITCESASSLARCSDEVLFAPTHALEGIVMSSSASLMLLLGLRLAGVEVSAAIPAQAEQAMHALDGLLSSSVLSRSHFVYLGGGAYYGLASEGALKLQEMSLTYTQVFHPMEYRHGPISLVDEKTCVVLIYSPQTRDEEAKLYAELKQKGALVIGFGGPGDLSVEVPHTGLHRSLVILPALQLLGERLAQHKHLDSTAPRHLTKVVRLS
ncbi:SIS domain-containing protein [Pseudomonas typographi]|uniref:SIS domain-containing protein n=1 Tax=Pseudomonas typographi TaxID=2715964 RepID=UPI00168A1477|nr:SIS domain-containing protein [Pseudomonas typographi]MBD1552224.1 SIS domain-containing protein [Pseudomonas typographi]